MVLLHKDFGVCNSMVNETSCNLVGVVDWAEAEVAPFGLNLHSHQRLISKVHLKNWLGQIRRLHHIGGFILEHVQQGSWEAGQ